MTVMAVDDEPIALENLKLTLDTFSEFHEIVLFRSPFSALEWLKKNRADIAFLDINMRQLDGLSLAKQLKEICPACSVIFVTGYSEYAVQAFQLHATGYLMKPVRREIIRRELDFIRNAPTGDHSGSNGIRVQCFGNFEVFYNGEPLHFQYQKTKELLAYLIDRKGAFCSNGELIGILWEERVNSSALSSQLRNLLADLLHTLKHIGQEDTIIKRRGMAAIIPEKFDCDYYNWLNGDITSVNAYTGEYMSQYSWGEFTLGKLEKHRPHIV